MSEERGRHLIEDEKREMRRKGNAGKEQEKTLREPKEIGEGKREIWERLKGAVFREVERLGRMGGW